MPIDPVARDPQQFQQVRTDFQSLAQALKAGNLSAAQKSYASLQEDQANGPQPPAGSPAANDIAALGQALQSGDLSGAQQAFSSLQSTIQSARQSRGAHGHGQGHGQGGGDQGAANDDNSQKTVSNEVTTTNANGTITVTTTYTDGTTSSAIQPNPNPVVSSTPLATVGGQLSVLLNAQQQANG